VVWGKGAIQVFPEVIEVEAYAGFKGAEQPRVFVWRGRRLRVERTQETWHQQDLEGKRKVFFRVEASDSKSYLLSHSSDIDEWSLEEEPR